MAIEEIITIGIPCLVSIATSSIGTAIISSISKKIIKRKVENIDEGKNLKEINKSLARIENEILEMRGKRK